MVNMGIPSAQGFIDRQIPPDERRNYRLELNEMLRLVRRPMDLPTERTVVRIDFDDDSEAFAAMVRFAPNAHDPVIADVNFFDKVQEKIEVRSRLIVVDREDKVIHDFSSLSDGKLTGRGYVGVVPPDYPRHRPEAKTPFLQRFGTSIRNRYPHLNFDRVTHGFWFPLGEVLRGEGTDGRTILLKCVRAPYGWVQFPGKDLEPFGRPGQPCLAQLMGGTRFNCDRMVNYAYTGVEGRRGFDDLPYVWIQSDGEFAYEILDASGASLETQGGFSDLRLCHEYADYADRKLG